MSTVSRTSFKTFVDEAVVDAKNDFEAVILTRPALLASGGSAVTYAADIRIVGSDAIIRNVPIAIGNDAIVYADLNAAVTVTRSRSGRLEITGFAKRKPGNRYRIPVNIADRLVGVREDQTVGSRLFAYDELAYWGTYGVIPYGSYGIFRGEELIETRT